MIPLLGEVAREASIAPAFQLESIFLDLAW